jgi:hypothetical protein
MFALSRKLIAFVFFNCELLYLELRPIMLHGVTTKSNTLRVLHNVKCVYVRNLIAA